MSRWNLPIHPPKSHSWKECLYPPHFSLAATDWLHGGLIKDYKQKSDEQEEEEEANSTGLYHLQPQLPWMLLMTDHHELLLLLLLLLLLAADGDLTFPNSSQQMQQQLTVIAIIIALQTYYELNQHFLFFWNTSYNNRPNWGANANDAIGSVDVCNNQLWFFWFCGLFQLINHGVFFIPISFFFRNGFIAQTAHPNVGLNLQFFKDSNGLQSQILCNLQAT